MIQLPGHIWYITVMCHIDMYAYLAEIVFILTQLYERPHFSIVEFSLCLFTRQPTILS